MRSIFPISILTAYQLELYEGLRFLRFIYTHPRYWFIGGGRQQVDWTMKARALFFVYLIFFILLFLNISSVSWTVALFTVVILSPFLFIVSNVLLSPLDIFLKRRIIEKARQKLRSHPNLKVIGITGSYGKTSEREILKAILAEKYKVLAPEGNKNTPLGVSETILRDLRSEHEIFIVEMGAYRSGNIRELCELVSPNIAILTGITLQHLERFGNIDDIVSTKFELPEAIENDGLILLDTSNPYVARGLQERAHTLRGKIITPEFPTQVTYLPDFGGISFEYDTHTIEPKLLADHNSHLLVLAYEAARHLGLESKDILSGIEKIMPVEHRLEPIYNEKTGVWIIDDAYNGNIEGVRSTIRLLTHTHGKRRIYLTPGLVELGSESERVHEMLGQEIGKVQDNGTRSIDLALLIDNPATRSLACGMKKGGFPEKDIIWYTTTELAHRDLPNILIRGDVIVFQNDWSDNYF